MTREELIAYDRWLTENKWGSSEIITPEQAADLYLAKHPLPPAEGAEQRIRVRNILQDFYRRGEYELEQAEEDIMRLFQPQPTAEGAEEILRKNCNTCYSRSTGEEEVWSSVSSVLIAMQDFATLHAQKMAEKMVKTDALLNRAAGLVGNPGANISSSCDIACIDWQKDYDEYLKSKEQ